MRGLVSGMLGVVVAGMDSMLGALASAAATASHPAPGTGGRSRSRNRYTGGELCRIRREGQARECARRLRQKAARSC